MAEYRKSERQRASPVKKNRATKKKSKEGKGYMPPRPRPFTREEVGSLRRMSDKDNWRRKDGLGDKLSEAMFKKLRKKSDERAKRTGQKYSDFHLLMKVYEYKKKHNFIRLKF